MSTKNDRAVLDTIFNPFLTNLSNLDENDDSSEGLSKELSDVEKRAIELELEAVKLAEGGHLDKSLDVLSEAIALSPSLASLYNDRAQVYRLLGKNKEALNVSFKILNLITIQYLNYQMLSRIRT